MSRTRASALAAFIVLGLTVVGCTVETVDNAVPDASSAGSGGTGGAGGTGGTGGTTVLGGGGTGGTDAATGGTGGTAPDGATGGTGGVTEAGSEAATEAAAGTGGAVPEAGQDVTQEAKVDAPQEATVDAAQEAAIDAGQEAAADVASDAKPTTGDQCHQVALEGSPVEIVVVAADAGPIPAPTGGTLTDGTYVLVDVTVYSSTTAEGPTGNFANETFQVSGSGSDSGTFNLYDVVDSATSTDRTTWTASVGINADGGAPTLSGSLSCPTGTDSWSNAYSVDVGVTTTLQVWDYKAGGDVEIRTYELQ
jgi:hypothetical protein